VREMDDDDHRNQQKDELLDTYGNETSLQTSDSRHPFATSFNLARAQRAAAGRKRNFFSQLVDTFSIHAIGNAGQARSPNSNCQQVSSFIIQTLLFAALPPRQTDSQVLLFLTAPFVYLDLIKCL